MDAFTEFIGADDIPYSVSGAIMGTTRTFTSFEDVVREVDHARIFGGMLFRHSVKEGNRLGRRVAEHVLRSHSQPKDDQRLHLAW